MCFFQHCLLNFHINFTASICPILTQFSSFLKVYFLLFIPQRLIRVDCELADHPYFTRSKARTSGNMNDSGASEQTGLGLVTLPREEPEASGGGNDELIAQLLQQMANMQTEIERLRNLTNLSITLNAPHPEQGTNTTIPPSFSPVDSPAPQPSPTNPALYTTHPNTSNPQQANLQQSTSQQSNPQQAIPPQIHSQPTIPQPTVHQQTIPQQTNIQQTTSQPNDQQQANLQQINFQQTNSQPFATPYILQPAVTQINPHTQNYQAVHHTPLAHIASHNTQYAAENHPFTTQVQALQHPEVAPYEELEREARARADEDVAKELRSLREAVRNIQTNRGCEGLEYEDLCIHPDIELPAGYKVPKFDMFDGKGNPRAHLRSYCDKLVGVGKDQAIRMKLFIRSLTGEALDWYTYQDPQRWHSWGDMAQEFMDRFRFNTETIPDRFYLMKLERKSTETFREYAMRWRAEAAKVQPPMAESEMTMLFVQSLKDPTYYERMLSVIGQKFAEVIRMGDFIEEGIKTGRVTNLAALQATSKAIQADPAKKKRDGVSPVMAIQDQRPTPKSTRQYSSPQPSHYSQYTQIPQPYYQPPPTPLPVYHTQPTYYSPRTPSYQNPPQHRPTYATQPQYHSPNRPQNTPRPRPNVERRPTKTYTPLAEPLAQLYERLKMAGILQPIQGRTPDPIPGWYDGTKHCAYHSGIAGHDTGSCFALKDRVEALIKEGVIQLKEAPPNINNNPLPNHGDANVHMITIDEDCNLEGTIVPVKEREEIESSACVAPIITVQKRAPFEVLTPRPRITTFVAPAPSRNTKAVPWDYQSGERDKGKGRVVVETVATGMTRSGRCYAPEEIARGAPSKENGPKKAVTEAEVEEFWRKMPTKEYSVVEQLKKTPAQISLFALLMSSEAHRSALVKILNEAYVPAETSSEKLSAMVGEILEAHRVSFHNDELPPEGLGHNKALNITIKCRDKFISKVLIDGGSAVNICPVATLRALGIDVGKLRCSQVSVKGFDGAQRDVVGEIDLFLEIGPVEFIVKFQVMDISTSYNLLIGRPWIHMAGAVPSTLHQSLKFVWNHQEVVIHGEGNNSLYPECSIPPIGNVEKLDGSVFHVKENVCAAQARKMELPQVLMMVAWEMLKNGFRPGQGLGLNSDGIVEPIQLPGHKYTFGLGYEPTPEEIASASLKRRSDVPLPKPVPCLNQSFLKASAAQASEGISEDSLLESFKNLFVTEEETECSMVSNGCSENPTIRDAEPGCRLNNWTCTPPPFLRESW